MTEISTTLDEHTLATLDRWLAYRLWHGGLPGSQVAIGVGGELIFSRAYGYADLEHRTPMRTDHLFRIASHAKTFTATRILQLVEGGRLGLEDRLGDHLREFAPHVIGDIVIRELLEHTSGLLRDGLDADFWQDPLHSRIAPNFLIANGGGYGSVGELVIFTEADDGR